MGKVVAERVGPSVKTVFIINPKAGQKKANETFVSEILKTAEKLHIEVEVIKTTCVGDGTRIAKACCEKYGAVRLIACGGDGTLNEVVNGAIGFQGAEVGVLPMGTGNDFCRNFQSAGAFTIENVLRGKVQKCDLIRFDTEKEDKIKTRYCVNMFNIGFDCEVADLTGTMKQKPFISGPFAYFISIFIALVQKKGANLKLSLDGKEAHNGPLLLSAISNGMFCGGGIKSNPLGSVQDGVMEINIIKNVTRTRLLTLLGSYMNGTFIHKKGIERFIVSKKCKTIDLEVFSENFRISVDGEIIDGGKTKFSVAPGAFSFVVPKK